MTVTLSVELPELSTNRLGLVSVSHYNVCASVRLLGCLLVATYRTPPGNEITPVIQIQTEIFFSGPPTQNEVTPHLFGFVLIPTQKFFLGPPTRPKSDNTRLGLIQIFSGATHRKHLNNGTKYKQTHAVRQNANQHSCLKIVIFSLHVYQKLFLYRRNGY